MSGLGIVLSFSIQQTNNMIRTVLAYLASGKSVDWILTQWPQLPREAVEEAMRLAANTLLKRYDGFEIA
ncbi:MAG: DUF433 domain-containing protein [bacterium]